VTLREAIDDVMAHPCKRGLKISTGDDEPRLLVYDPSFDDTGLLIRPPTTGGAAGFGFGVCIFSINDLLSDAHEVVDVDVEPFRL
jgi:hypothetical protein